MMQKVKKSFSYQWVMVACCFLMIFVALGFGSTPRKLFMVAVPKALELEYGPYSLSETFRYISTAIVNLFFGTLVFKFGPRKLIGSGFVLLSGAMLLRRCVNAMMICPGFSKEGVCAGRSLYLPWENVRFAYVHRIAKMSGFYLLSNPHGEMLRRGAPPVVCLSMPDTSTLLLAYLTYCPHADRGMRP